MSVTSLFPRTVWFRTIIPFLSIKQYGAILILLIIKAFLKVFPNGLKNASYLWQTLIRPYLILFSLHGTNIIKRG
ncbi:MAG TPA: hypothetical protein DEV72_10350 [Ktedonobacter sp.]|nr:hypothetical protein [Ktedonobacter sp.]